MSGRQSLFLVAAAVDAGDNGVMLDRHVRAALEEGRFAFIDAGCASGRSLDHCTRRFGCAPGLGLDWYSEDLKIAADQGFSVAQCDLFTADLPRQCVTFTSMVDFLEHLQGVEAAASLLDKFAAASRQFLFIRHPSFDNGEYLRGLGLKLAWTDWRSHSNPMEVDDFRRIFERFGWRKFAIVPDLPILDSSHPAVLPAGAAGEAEEYDAAAHGPKPFVQFNRVVYGKYDIFVCLDPAMPDEEWQRIAAIDGWRAIWESAAARQLATGADPLSYWLDSLARGHAADGALPDEATRARLRALVERGIAKAPRRAVSLTRALDQLARSGDTPRVVVRGADADFSAAYISARFPALNVDAVEEPVSDGSASLLESAIERLVAGLDEAVVRDIVADVFCLARLDLDPVRHARLLAWPGRDAGVDLSTVFDPWLQRSGRALNPVAADRQAFLSRHVAECIALKRYFFLRLAHLMDAVGRIPEPIEDVLSIGVGMAYQEAFLAGRCPNLRVLATDTVRTSGTFPFSNLRFGHLDLNDPPGAEHFDLVLSIETLEHIADPRRAFRHKAARVRPGKYLYVSVPFASRDQQRDPKLREYVWRECEHYTPGFTFEDLESLCDEHGLEIVHASNMFHLDVVLPLRRIIDRLPPDEVLARAGALAQLLLLDVEDRRVADSRQSEGIRVLARKRGSPRATRTTGRTAAAPEMDRSTFEDLAAGVYAFVDGGCGIGGSLDHCERRFARRPGLGVDADAADVLAARQSGYRAVRADLQQVELPDRCVEFVSLMDVLEHLPDVAAARRVVTAFGRAAREFLYIRHPSFEDVETLAALGLKFGWTDWTDHPNRMRLEDFHQIFASLSWHDVAIRPTLPIEDSTHAAIVPLSAPTDTVEYVEALHGAKPVVRFGRPMFGKFDIFVKLNPAMPDAEWQRITSIDGWEGTWAPPGRQKIADVMAARRMNGRRPAVTDRDVHAVVDALLWRQVAHVRRPTPASTEALVAALAACVAQRDRGALHLVHLLEAFNETIGVRTVLASGITAAPYAAAIAARCPDVTIDLEPADSRRYDFVFAIEPRGAPVLDETRLRALWSSVGPGGWLYVAVPLDAGVDVAGPLDRCLRGGEYETLSTAAAFSADLATALDDVVSVIDPPDTVHSLEDLIRLAVLDLDPRWSDGHSTRLGVKYLVRRRR